MLVDIWKQQPLMVSSFGLICWFKGWGPNSPASVPQSLPSERFICSMRQVHGAKSLGYFWFWVHGYKRWPTKPVSFMLSPHGFVPFLRRGQEVILSIADFPFDWLPLDPSVISLCVLSPSLPEIRQNAEWENTRGNRLGKACHTQPKG